MKQKLRVFLTLLLCAVASVGWAEEEILDFSAQGYPNGQGVSILSGTNVKIDLGGGSNAPAYFTTGTAVRLYGGGKMTVSTLNEKYVITKIVITFTGGNSYKPSNNNIVNVGSYDANTNTWTGETSSVEFTRPSGSGHWRIQEVAITYQASGSATDPSIDADNVDIVYDATSGSIAYTIENEVDGGEVSATTTSDWLILGTVGTTVPFTCSANEAKSEREATVTLTYTYGDNQTVTKNVTVTQAGNPNAVDKISDITAAGTYAVQGTIVAKSQRGFVVGDGTGYVYYYNKDYTQAAYNVGDKVKLSGSVVAYGGVFEFNSSTTITSVTESNYVAENPTVLTGAQMNELVASTTPALSGYVQYEGTLSVSGTHYNITNIDGATTAVGSISYPLNTDFASLNGKTVKVTGYYVGVSSSTYYNTMLGSIEEVKDATPIIDANDVTLNYDATSGEIVYTVNNAVEGKSLSAATTADWISNISVGASSVTFTVTANEGTEDRSATFTLSYEGAENKIVTVTQKHHIDEFATLPFEFNGGKADIEDVAGLTETGLDSDYKEAPFLKFDSSNDEVVLKFNERPGVLTFDIKGNSFSGGTFKVQTSEDGTTYTDLKSYTELASNTQSESFNTLGENVRYIKWVYTQKVSGNVALGNINLEKYVAPQSYTLTIPNTVNVIITAAYGTDGVLEEGEDGEIEQGTEITLTVDVADGYDLQSLTVDGLDGQSFTPSAVAGTEGTYKFTMPAYNATVNAAVVEHVEPSGDEVWEKTNLADLTPSDVFVIVGNNGDYYAMSNDNGTSSAPAAVAVTISDDKITSAVAENIKWNISIDEDGYTFYPNGTTETWLYCTNTNNGVRVGTNDNKTFTVSEEGYLVNAATSRYVGIYNSQDWRCYTSINSNIEGQTFSFYKKVESTQTIEVKISAAGYATFANANPVDFTGTDVKVMTAQYANGKITYAEVTSKQVPAGKAVILQGNQGTYNATVIASAAALENNNLQVDLEKNLTSDGTYYCLANKSKGVGFYKVANGTIVKQGKAYLVIPAEAKDFFSINDETDGIGQIEMGQTSNAEIYNLSGQRVNKAQKGIYIVNGKKVVVK